jgi:predicted nucleotidyltransferase
MHPAIAQHRAGITAICQRYRIQRLEVFGSAARADDFDPASSDADFLVEFAPGVQPGLDSLFGAKAALETLLGRGVDLVEPGAVCNPYVLTSINRNREAIYAA